MYIKNSKTFEFKGVIFIWGVLVFGLLFLGPANLHGEDTGFKYFKNYGYREYEHQAQNWGMAQAENGIIYVANHGGVLEFDGVSWRVIGIPGYAPVRSLAIDKTGTIYIGGIGKIGYLAPDSQGTLKYVSLVDQMDDRLKNFADVWNTHAAGEGVYFGTIKALYRWSSRRIKEWEPDYPIYGTYLCKGEIFVYLRNAGLMKMVNDGLELLPGGEKFATARRIFMIVPYDSRRLLIGTRPGGFFVYDGKTIVPFSTEADDYLNEKNVSHGIRLSNGDLALATRLGGLVIIDSQGRLKHIFDKTYGLQEDNVKYVFEDKQGNLWVSLGKGISKIEYASPISIHDERSNLSGIVLSVVRHHNDLYVGTTKGLYYLQSRLKFRPVPGISGICRSLLSIENSILAAADGGVFQVNTENNTERKIIKVQSYALLPSKHYPGRIWCGTLNGLSALIRRNNQWIEEYRFEAVKKPVQHIAEEKNGSLWLVTSPGDVLYIDFRANFADPVVTPYGMSQGLPGGEIYPATAAGHVMFATEKGLFQFDEKTKTFIPDGTLGAEFAGGPNSKPVFRIAEDKNKNIWFHSQSRNYLAVPGPGKSFTVDSTPFRRIPLIQVNAFYPDPNGNITWFASFEGLIRYDTTVKKNYRQGFQTLLRKVSASERLIFDGCKNIPVKGSNDLLPVFEYKERNLYFEFAAPFFAAETETRYRCLLEGYDDDWSTWSKDAKRSYTNLDAGLYRFRVQAKNVYEHKGKEAEFRFKILPPWYGTWWAFLFYALLLILAVFLIVKWRSGRLEQEKQRLESVVKERTKEVYEKNELLEEQSQKLKELDQVKSRFFANISHEFRTPLTLIMGPLEQMFSDTRDKKQKDKLKVMLRNSQRLLTLINQLLDLSRIDSGKMKLQAACQDIVPFLKGIWASFHMLAQQNKLNLEFHCQEEDISLYFDAQKIEEMMVNLLINAVKFTPPGGEIAVSVSIDRRPPSKERRRYPGFVKISVRDTGIGIPKEQLAHIFDRFYQVGGLKETALKGTGIGLALTKEIVLLHHGKIDVHSQEGKRTEFVILLPMGYEHLKADEIAVSPGTASDNKRAIDVETLYMIEEDVDRDAGEQVDETVAIDRDTASENKSEEQEKHVILVVEDHADVRKYIREPLEQFYTVVEAGDGKEGIDKAKEIIPDLIVSDIMMPEADGYELCRELKKDIKTSHIPTILLTAKASEESIIQGLETGADDYITKPFNTKILMTRIKNLIDLRRQLQQKIQKQMLLQPAEISVSSMDREFIDELQEVIEKNLSDPGFHVEGLSKKLYMNRATLYRKIMALTGETPTQFIRSYRLKRAAQLLRDNFGTVSQVSLEVGITNVAYFARCFKEKFHQLPSTYQTSESK